MKNLKFRMTYKEMRLLMFHRNQYRSEFSRSIRKLFSRFRVIELYDHIFGYVVELYDYLFYRNKIWATHKSEMITILNTISKYLPQNNTAILDIGAGFGGIDLVLFHHFKSKPTLYLLDKDSISYKRRSGYNNTAESFYPYNSFRHARSFLERNGVPSKKIKTIDIGKETFPDDIKFDMVVSLLAWGFHFPVSTYIDKVYSSLVEGGSLIMDIRKDTEGISVIEGVFGRSPEILYEDKKFCRIGIKK